MSLVWRSRSLVAIGAITLYLSLVIAEICTKAPYLDEFFVAKPAYNLAFHGFPGTTGLEMAGASWSGIDKLTYNTLPAGIIALAVFFKLFGFGLLTTRFLSLALSVVVLFSTLQIANSCDKDSRRSLLTVALLCLNYSFVLAASFGRVDMMTAAAGLGAQAVYLFLRTRNLDAAITCGSLLLTISCLTHPNGILYLLCWITLVLWQDHTRLTFSHVVLFVLPLLAGVTVWLVYASRSPDDARHQLLVNAKEHKFLSGIRNPIGSIIFEFKERYLHGVFEWNAGPRPPIAVRLKGFVALGYLVSVIGVLLTPSLRRKPFNQLILFQTGIVFFYLCFLEGLKFPWYLLVPVPLYCALLADFALYQWDRRLIPRWTLSLIGLGLITIHLGGVVYRIVQDPYHRDYLPAVRFLKQKAKPSDLVFAKCDFGFGYGFDRNLLDDSLFGLKSGKTASFLVRDQAVDWDLNAWKDTNPVIYKHISHLFSSYKLVYQRGDYRIYELPSDRTAKLD